MTLLPVVCVLYDVNTLNKLETTYNHRKLAIFTPPSDYVPVDGSFNLEHSDNVFPANRTRAIFDGSIRGEQKYDQNDTFCHISKVDNMQEWLQMNRKHTIRIKISQIQHDDSNLVEIFNKFTSIDPHLSLKMTETLASLKDDCSNEQSNGTEIGMKRKLTRWLALLSVPGWIKASSNSHSQEDKPGIPKWYRKCTSTVTGPKCVYTFKNIGLEHQYTPKGCHVFVGAPVEYFQEERSDLKELEFANTISPNFALEIQGRQGEQQASHESRDVIFSFQYGSNKLYRFVYEEIVFSGFAVSLYMN